MISKLDSNFSSLNIYIKDLNPSKILILVDENTHHYCLPDLLGNLETDIPFEIIEIEAGEDLKTIETATQIWEILSEFETDRKALLINLGGGVITDLGGFIASTYKRGIRFINIPTTLLGMCDASIGGKTGIDHQFLKNIIGTFSQPEKIFLYPNFLETLPFEQLRSGFAEMLKHGLITDEKHWNDLISIKDLSAESVASLIERSMNIKSEIVEKDFKEQNLRKILNFGHTIGHAVESLFLKKNQIIPHGECVALGMIAETHLSYLEGLLEEDIAKNIIQKICRFFPKINIDPFSNDEILELMINDKKNEVGEINFTLLKNIGISVYDCHCKIENINSCLKFYRDVNY